MVGLRSFLVRMDCLLTRFIFDTLNIKNKPNKEKFMVQGVIDRLPHLGSKGDYLKQIVRYKLYIDKYGQDVSEIRNWKWGGS